MFFVLKLTWKFIKLCIKVVKLPLKLLSIILGNVNANSEDVTNLADSGRAKITESEYDESAEVQTNTGETSERSTGDVGTGNTESEISLGTASNSTQAHRHFRRFRQALYALAILNAASFIWTAITFRGPFGYIFSGNVIAIAALTAGLPAGIGLLSRRKPRQGWMVGMGYAGIILLATVIGASQFVLGVPRPRVFGDVPLLALLQVANLIALGAVVYSGIFGREIALRSNKLLSATAERTKSTTKQPQEKPTQANGPRNGGQSAETGPSPDSAATRKDRQDTDSKPFPTDQGIKSNEQRNPNQEQVTDNLDETSDSGEKIEPSDAPVDDATSNNDDEQLDKTGEQPDKKSSDGKYPEDIINQLQSDPIEPDNLRKLGQVLHPDDVNDEVIQTLEACSDSDDEEVKLAVCDVCSSLETDATDSILEGLRIDTNNKVATAAMDAL